MQQSNQNTPFAHLLGQDRAKKLLERSLLSGRIAHAYLFRGPDGVGKKLFAAAVARAINCTEAGPGSSCGECLSCRKYASGNHPDYSVESPEKGAIKIGRVREVCRSLAYPPYESEKRVVVMEDVHTMRQEAANCLLKTLEEPPEDNVIILTAEASRSVLTTISSRCQIIPFFPLSQEETRGILESEEHGLNSEHAAVLARLAEGSPGRALLLHKTEMVETWQNVTNVLSDQQYKEDRHAGLILQLAEQMAALKENLLPLLGLLRLWLRDLLVETATGRSQGEDIGRRGKKESEDLSIERILTKIKSIDRAEQQLTRNCNRSLVCEILLFRLQ
jgi:DNA polymerase-3 subunit delta'